MATTNNIKNDHSEIEDESKSVNTEKKPKAHIIRRNLEDYLEQKALERRIGEVFDESLHFGW